MRADHRIEVDWTRCDGHGLCASLLPERIALDELGFPLIADPEIGPATLAHARRTVAACPQLALWIGPAPDPQR